MPAAALHRRWAREYLDRAQKSPSRRQAAEYLRLAVSVRAKALEVAPSKAFSDGHLSRFRSIPLSSARTLRA